MRFDFRWLQIVLPAVLLAVLAAPLPAQAPASPAGAPASVNLEPANGSQQGNAPQQAYTLPPDQLAKAIALNRIRNVLDIAGSLWGIVVIWLLLATRCAAWLEGWAQRLSPRQWIQGAAFFAAFLAITALASLPLDVIGHHYSLAYGISVQGWAGWFADTGKAFGLTLLVGVPILLLFNRIVKRWSRRYWLAAWVVTLPILVFLIFVSPLLVPLFYKQEPLQNNHAALVAKLESVVARTGIDIPPDRMYLLKASAKTNGLNAYVSGIGTTKRIVVWDTTAGRIPDDEVLFIFGHESGHYVLHHIPKGIAIYSVALFFIYWICAALAAWMVRRFGARWGLVRPEQFTASEPLLSSRAGFVVLLFTISILSFVLQPAANAISRHFEHQADVFGQEAIHGIVPDPQKTAVAAFNALGQSWLEDPNPSPFIEFWLYDHPSVQRRAEFAIHYNPWTNGGHGKFFGN